VLSGNPKKKKKEKKSIILALSFLFCTYFSDSNTIDFLNDFFH
jgi:hypothetical protein